MTNSGVYAPFTTAFEQVTKKRHIHKCELYTGRNEPGYGLFLQTKITPHRSKGGVCLMFIFSTSVRKDVEKPLVKIEVKTHSSAYDCDAGALADAMMLIAELVTCWTAIAEEGTA